MAKKFGGILLTEDKDFGELVYAYGIKDISVIFLRYDQPIYDQIENALLQAVATYFATPFPCFITISKNKIRLRKL